MRCSDGPLGGKTGCRRNQRRAPPRRQLAANETRALRRRPLRWLLRGHAELSDTLSRKRRRKRRRRLQCYFARASRSRGIVLLVLDHPSAALARGILPACASLVVRTATCLVVAALEVDRRCERGCELSVQPARQRRRARQRARRRARPSSAREEDREADALPNFAYKSFLRASIWSAQLCLSASSASTSVRILSSCAWRCSSASEAGRCTKVVSSLYLLRVDRRERGEGGRRGGKRRGGAGRQGGGGGGDSQFDARSL